MAGYLSDILAGYKKLTIPDESVRKEAQKIIKELFKEDVDIKNFKLVRGVLRISVTGPLRSEIAIQKKLILEKLKGSLGNNAPKDIV